ncbi:MAG: alpha/beta hydrolase-fold protein [Bacteroidales bacterium]
MIASNITIINLANWQEDMKSGFKGTGCTVTHRIILFALMAVIFMVCMPINAICQDANIVGPDYTPDSLLADLNNPWGSQFEFELSFDEGCIYAGDDPALDPEQPLRKNRKIYVYIPAAYKDGSRAPLLVTLDGPSHFYQICNAMNNLSVQNVQHEKLPAFVLISVENGGGLGKGSQRSLEYDTMSDRFARFIDHEVLPGVLNNEEIRERYPGFILSEDPWDRAVMGCSSGGAAAFTMGWFRPDLFRRIVSYSGTFVDQQTDELPEELIYPLGAWEYHSGMKLIEKSEKKPLRVFIHVSEHDFGYEAPEESHLNWVLANERIAKELNNKGYDYRYLYSLDSDHCDARVFEHTLVQTLLWIWSEAGSR